MVMHPREGGRKNPFGRTPMNRRDFLRRSGMTAASLPLASAILAACGTGSSGGSGSEVIDSPARPDKPVTLPISEDNLSIADGLPPEKGPLQLYNWEEYIKQKTVDKFSEQFNVEVIVNTFNTSNDALAALTSGEVPFDVFFPTIDLLGKLAVSKLIRPLNKTYIPNLANVWDVFQGTNPSEPFYDVGAQYAVPYTVYTTGVAWRVDLGGPAEDYVPNLENPYDVMWDPKWRGKTHILDDYRDAIGMTLLKNGIYDVNTDDANTRAQSLQTAERELLDLIEKVDVQADVSDYTDMPEGKSLVHQAWSGDMVSGQYYFPAGTTDKDVIRYWAPEENMMIANDLMAVLRGGSNPVLAHMFLDFMLDFNVEETSGNAIDNFQFNGYVPPMKGLKNEDLIKAPGVPFSVGRVVQPSLATCLPTEEDFTVGHQLCELTPDVDSQWKDVWEVFQTGG